MLITLQENKITFTKIEEDSLGKIIGRFDLRKDYHNEGNHILYFEMSDEKENVIFSEKIAGTFEVIQKRLFNFDLIVNMVRAA